MNADRILLLLGRRAAGLTAARDPAVARAARRARGAIAMVRHAVRDDVDARMLVAAAIEAVVILAALESRDRRRADRGRARGLARGAPVPQRKVTDVEIATALAANDGHVRQAAAALGVSPSTVSRRRSVAGRDGTQQSCRGLTAPTGSE